MPHSAAAAAVAVALAADTKTKTAAAKAAADVAKKAGLSTAAPSDAAATAAASAAAAAAVGAQNDTQCELSKNNISRSSNSIINNNNNSSNIDDNSSSSSSSSSSIVDSSRPKKKDRGMPVPTDVIDERYRPLCKLGEGTYGMVYSAWDYTTSSTVAIKKVKLDQEGNGMPSTSLREIAVLKELHHENIVRLLHVMYKDSKQLNLVFEYSECDLKKYMEESSGPLDRRLIRSFMYQLVSGIDYCHERRIVHRDLKPVNLLIDRNARLKIADFGLARCFGVPMRNYTHEVVTLWYRAPEILLGINCYGVGVDIWSIGCIFAEMHRKEALFDGDAEIDQLFRIFRVLGTPNTETWPGIDGLKEWKPYFPQWRPTKLSTLIPEMGPEAIRLLSEMILLFPGRRISARRTLKHDYFSGFNIEDFIQDE